MKNIIMKRFLATMAPAFFGTAQTGRADPLATWTVLTSLPTGNRMNGVIYGNSEFVAVGESGIILTSPGGTNWVVRGSGTSAYLSAIAYGNGQFVAVGDLGTIVASADGVNWAERQSGTDAWLFGLAYGNG